MPAITPSASSDHHAITQGRADVLVVVKDVSGSYVVYSEPAGGPHFARTGAEPVLVQISGIGPTDTRYIDAPNEPRTAH
jgi:hypothetical protein